MVIIDHVVVPLTEERKILRRCAHPDPLTQGDDRGGLKILELISEPQSIITSVVVQNISVRIKTVKEFVEVSTYHKGAPTRREVAVIAPDKSRLLEAIHREFAEEREIPTKRSRFHP